MKNKMVKEIHSINFKDCVEGYCPVFVREYIEAREIEQEIGEFRRFDDRLESETYLMWRDGYFTLS